MASTKKSPTKQASKKTADKKVVIVPNVKVHGVVRAVKFVARAKKVVVKSKGMPNIIVRPARGLESDKKPFEAIVKGNSIVCMAVSPDKAFAHAAAEFWKV